MTTVLGGKWSYFHAADCQITRRSTTIACYSKSYRNDLLVKLSSIDSLHSETFLWVQLILFIKMPDWLVQPNKVPLKVAQFLTWSVCVCMLTVGMTSYSRYLFLMNQLVRHFCQYNQWIRPSADWPVSYISDKLIGHWLSKQLLQWVPTNQHFSH